MESIGVTGTGNRWFVFERDGDRILITHQGRTIETLTREEAAQIAAALAGQTEVGTSGVGSAPAGGQTTRPMFDVGLQADGRLWFQRMQPRHEAVIALPGQADNFRAVMTRAAGGVT